MTDLPFHPLAEIFPLIEGQEFDDLVADIKARGLREPLSTFDGMIVDGRNRYRACKAAEVKLVPGDIGELDPSTDLIAFVISANLRRRHMDDDARAMVAARLATYKHGGDRSKSPIGGMSQAAAGAALNVRKRKVERAAKVIKTGSQGLVAAVDKREVSISAAAAVASLPDAEQQKIVDAGPEAIKEAARAIRETPKETADPVETKGDPRAKNERAAAEMIVRYVPADMVEPLLRLMSDSRPSQLPGAVRQAVERSRKAAVAEPETVEPPEAMASPAVVEVAEPAVPTKESISQDRLACLDCGRQFKTLVRHLREEHSLTPEGYRAKWGLPADAPMNTPDHARVLSEKAANRGRRRSSEVALRYRSRKTAIA